MTRRLILVRHAKSDWTDSGLSDHDRSLNDRGRRAAPRMGDWLRARGHRPEAALLSTARRVAETWEGLGFADVTPRWSKDLYLAPPATILGALKGVEARCVMVVAHNPGMASLAQWIAEEPPQRSEFERFPTCATLVVEFDRNDWQIEPLTGRVLDFAVPRDLG